MPTIVRTAGRRPSSSAVASLTVSSVGWGSVAGSLRDPNPSGLDVRFAAQSMDTTQRPAGFGETRATLTPPEGETLTRLPASRRPLACRHADVGELSGFLERDVESMIPFEPVDRHVIGPADRCQIGALLGLLRH